MSLSVYQCYRCCNKTYVMHRFNSIVPVCFVERPQVTCTSALISQAGQLHSAVCPLYSLLYLLRMSAVSITSLVDSSSSPLRALAQGLKASIPQLFDVEEADKLLKGDISSVTHEISDKLEKLGKDGAANPQEMHKVETARLLVLQLRFAVAAERQECPKFPCHEDNLTVGA